VIDRVTTRVVRRRRVEHRPDGARSAGSDVKMGVTQTRRSEMMRLKRASGLRRDPFL
jgi:hypothetical protein